MAMAKKMMGIVNAYLNMNNQNGDNNKDIISQVSIQLFSNIIILIINFTISIVATKNILPQEYGEYRYIITYLLLIPGLINLGFANSVGRLIAINIADEHNKISGYGFVVGTVLAVGFVIVVMPILIVLKVDDLINVTWLFIYTTPFIILTTLQLFVQTILTGQNRIHSLAFFNLVPQFTMLGAIIIQIYVFKYSNTLTLLMPYIVINGAAILYRIYKCEPAKVKLVASYRFLKEENKKFGLLVYIGSIFGVLVGQAVGLISGHFLGMEKYGNFALAFSFVAPFQMLASTFGTVLYRSNVTRIELPFSLFSYVIGFNLIAYTGFYLVIDSYFVSLFSIKYIDALPYMKLLAIYGMLVGLGDFVNRFLGAKGYGYLLMIGAILTGISVLIAAFVLVPIYQIEGLIFSYLISGMVYLFCMFKGYFNYRRLISKPT